ncbi:hypothetical protein PCANC_06161 [Puccinia coronata f. sp. avenae]|uniref:Uncharacterized protein n=1 Tax=Puccinia coronata f. sp. avenae TaxID=200324 RepID=A0A2N5VTH6_9BASI|nr:hypothetical protein PCANC_06161 [Puccinia coronata f. sp. avenae]
MSHQGPPSMPSFGFMPLGQQSTFSSSTDFSQVAGNTWIDNSLNGQPPNGQPPLGYYHQANDYYQSDHHYQLGQMLHGTALNNQQTPHYGQCPQPFLAMGHNGPQFNSAQLGPPPQPANLQGHPRPSPSPALPIPIPAPAPPPAPTPRPLPGWDQLNAHAKAQWQNAQQEKKGLAP